MTEGAAPADQATLCWNAAGGVWDALAPGDLMSNLLALGPAGSTWNANGLGIGAAPAAGYPLTILMSNAGALNTIIRNTSAAATAETDIRAQNDVADNISIGIVSSAYAAGGLFPARRSYLNSNSPGGLLVRSSSGGISFGLSNNANIYMTLDASGFFKAGGYTGSAASHYLTAYNNTEGTNILGLSGTSSDVINFFVAAAASSASSTNCAMRIGRAASNSRSINASGTLNASGADYAEYETKANGCGVVAKGQIVGFDANGEITDKWASAVSFGVKSTDPNLVGGDVWGTPEALGLEYPDRDDVDFAAKKEAYDTALEAARQNVDRVSYSGKVPVNVTGAVVGDYIIAVQSGDGIGGQAVANPTFDQYRVAVGRVRKILADGRAYIAVIVH